MANIALRKLGGYERWLMGWAERIRDQGDSLEIWTLEPTLDEVAQRLDELGVVRRQLSEYRGTRRDPDHRQIIWASFMGMTDRPMRRVLLSFGVPLVLYDRTSGSGGVPGLKKKLWRAGMGMLLRKRVSSVVGNSRFVVDRNHRIWGFHPDKLHTIYNAVTPPSPWQPRRNAIPEILCVAYLIPEKGVDTLIAAMGRLQELPWRLRIVGDGPEQAHLEQQAATAGIADRVEFMGHQKDVSKLQRAADIIVHPARWAEACANTILEGLSAGTPVIVTDMGGNAELVTDGVTGMVVPVDYVRAMSEAIHRLLVDPLLREQLGQAAHDSAAERFSMELNLTALTKISHQIAR